MISAAAEMFNIEPSPEQLEIAWRSLNRMFPYLTEDHLRFILDAGLCGRLGKTYNNGLVGILHWFGEMEKFLKIPVPGRGGVWHLKSFEQRLEAVIETKFNPFVNESERYVR